MTAHLERAQLLLAQSRPGDAEREALQALAAQPDQPHALALLALCRIEQDKRAPALEAAREAVGLAPDVAYFHYVHGLILHRSDREEDAFRAAQEALRLDPDDADIFCLLASIELARRRWSAALQAAERALALNPEHVGAANLRSMALVRLGRKAEAMTAIDYALHRAPENALSHANQGWNCLHRNDPKQAQEHFREALRLEPTLDYAREGMLEAMKARNPVYRGMLAYFLWIGRQSSGLRWAFVVGVLVFSETLHRLAAKHAAFWIPILLLYLFVYLSWTAMPMFNLLLRLNRFGRYLLSPDQRRASNWFGGVLLAAALSFAAVFFGGGAAAFYGSLMLVALSICVAATFHRTGRERLILALASLALTGIGAYACFAIAQGDRETAGTFIRYFTNGFLIFQVGTIFLGRR